MIRRLGIAGVGLIGGSLALAARRAGLAGEVVGLGRGSANLEVALARGILDRAGTDPGILAGCDLVLLATPVGAIVTTAAAIAPHLPDGAILTDAGSVKDAIVAAATAAAGARLRFVGGHPIAGTEAQGAAAADPDLFRGARCVLTPVSETDAEALSLVRRLWESVGMDVVEMSPRAHDDVLALTSHVPHVIAFALAHLAGETAAGAGDALAFAGPSFRSATRVAASSTEMWRDILVANAPAVGRVLDRVVERLGRISAQASSDPDALHHTLDEARAARMRLDGPGREARPDRQDPGGTVRIGAATGPLLGEVRVPGDKSIAHRAILLGAVAHGVTVVRGVGGGQDNASTIRVMRALGVPIERRGETVRITGRGFEGLAAPDGVLDCGNSGTTMRLLCGLLAARPFEATLDGDESLRRRPMGRVTAPLSTMGATFESESGRPPVRVRGASLRPGRFVLDVASAQVKTALLLAGLQSEGETAVREPAASRDHTERILPAFGGAIERRSGLEVAVRGPQRLHAAEIDVPGDPSAATFWLVVGSIVPGSRVVVRRVGVNPTRTGAIDVLRAMGARIEVVPGDPVGEEPVADLVVSAGPLRGVDVSGETMLRAIDEFPVLAVAAACALGETCFRDAAELRVKESDRIAAMARGLATLGADVEERADGLVVRGPAILGGGVVESHGDHRIAMAFAVAALVAAAAVEIRGADAIAVSDPGFLDTMNALRGGPR